MTSTDLVPAPVVDAELVDDHEALPALPGDAVDINELLTDEAEEDLANSGRENTRETYESRFKAFANWCAARGRRPGPRTTEANLVSYVSHLRRQGIGHDTIRLSIAAIVDMNARAGHEKWPPTAKALKIYADARHEQREAGRTSREAPPLDMERRLQMLDACPDTLAGLRDRVIGHLGYYCRGRRSELAKFRVASVEDVGPDLMVVRKWTSKNDKNDKGREYEIDDPEAVADIRRWIAELVKREQGAPHMPLLRRVNKGDNLDPVSKKGWGLTPHAINEITKKMAQRADLDVKDNATSHGWRAGVPADLGRLGYSAGEIKDITGDWSSTEQVEKYRKIGRRRAGRKANDGRRAGAIAELHKLRTAAEVEEPVG
ncbi:tyrosine-type recombinase/integrase [Streptomyces ipomoeae]|uniref:tyrosine-type recombinase/integrase n=1 Tax=Streptomyces ipomoeae TaxID=103232 RepID=UPI00114737B0|nr:tyrosine-type recombinase/integrase [Streptomyces ipomoeae]TQE33097.1 hypothetical protein Sipo7851_21585 [Streptomyces ipomoeae]